MKLLEETLRSIEPADPEFRRRAETRILNFAMPPWALGRLLDLAVDLAGITRSETPPVARKRIVLMAGDHGIAAEGVCPQPSSITAQAVRNFVRGGGGISLRSGPGRRAGGLQGRSRHRELFPGPGDDP